MGQFGKVIKITPHYGETVQWGSDYKKYNVSAEVELIDCSVEEIEEKYKYMCKMLRDAVRRRIDEDLLAPARASAVQGQTK
jgi:hypothetical protein